MAADDGVIAEVTELLRDLLLCRGLLQLELVAPVHVGDVCLRAVFLHVRGDLFQFGVQLREFLVLEDVDALGGVGVQRVVAVQSFETLVVDGAEGVVDDADFDSVDIDDGILLLIGRLEGAGGLESFLAKDLDCPINAVFPVISAVVVRGDEEVEACILQRVRCFGRQLEMRVETEVPGFGDGELEVADGIVCRGDLIFHVRENGVEVIAASGTDAVEDHLVDEVIAGAKDSGFGRFPGNAPVLLDDGGILFRSVRLFVEAAAGAETDDEKDDGDERQCHGGDDGDGPALTHGGLGAASAGRLPSLRRCFSPLGRCPLGLRRVLPALPLRGGPAVRSTLPTLRLSVRILLHIIPRFNVYLSK